MGFRHLILGAPELPRGAPPCSNTSTGGGCHRGNSDQTKGSSSGLTGWEGEELYLQNQTSLIRWKGLICSCLQLPPLALTSPPGSTAVCPVGCNHHPHPGKGWAAARQHSPAPQSHRPSRQMPLTSLALLPAPAKPWSQGHLCSAGRDGANHQPTAGWLLLPPLPSFPELQAQGHGMQSATEDRRGLRKHWALAAVPAVPASKGDCSGKPPRTSLHFIQRISQPLSCCNPDRGTALPCTSSLRTLQAPRSPHHSGGHGRNSSSWREVSQVLRLHPHLFRRLILLGDLQTHCTPQTSGQRLCPGTKPAEPDTGQSHAWSGLALCRSAARVQQDLSVWTDVQDAKFKFKLQGGCGERETESPWMESRQRHCTGPNTCTFFCAHVTPAGGRKGRASSSHSSCARLSPHRYVEPREILNESPQPHSRNHVTLTMGASVCASESPVGPPRHGDHGAEPWPGLTGSSWQWQTSDCELPLTEAEVIKTLGGGCGDALARSLAAARWCVPLCHGLHTPSRPSS